MDRYTTDQEAFVKELMAAYIQVNLNKEASAGASCDAMLNCIISFCDNPRATPSFRASVVTYFGIAITEILKQDV